MDVANNLQQLRWPEQSLDHVWHSCETQDSCAAAQSNLRELTRIIHQTCAAIPRQGIHRYSRHSQNNILYNFLFDLNLVAANTLSCCRGATCSYVSCDNSSNTLIDLICLPVEMSDLIAHTEIVDDHCLNVCL